MNGFSTFIASFCGSSVIIGLLYILVPEKYSKIIKFLFGLIFIFSVLSAFLKIESIDFPKAENYYIEQSKDDLLIEQARLTYEKVLDDANINFSKLQVCTNKQNDSIIISKVIIYSAEEKGKILNALGSLSEAFEVEIINE